MLNVIHPDEQFKKIYKHYLISNYGRVYSLRHEKFMVPMKNNKGYYRFENGEMKNGVRSRKLIFIHIAVVEAFGDCHGKIYKGHLKKAEVDHLDRNKRNNAVDNLELVTHHENMQRYFESKRAASDCLDF